MKRQQYAIYPSVFGRIKICYTDRAITFLKRIEDTEEQGEGETSALSDLAFSQLREYFDGKRKTFDFPYELHGTEFQQKVWRALCDIPYGETRTYKEIASAVGNPRASRAVGMANHQNPITIAVPCHRVIGATGKPVGYACGIEMKMKLLEMERVN